MAYLKNGTTPRHAEDDRGERRVFKDLVKKSRSFRGYDSTYQISRQELEDLVDTARYAPSSVNRQPFQYYIACEKEDVDRIQPLTGWARALPEAKLPHPGKEPSAFILICQNLDWDPDETRYVRDVGIVAQTMLLAAAEKGLGGIMIGNYSPARVSEALNLPENLSVMLIVAVGKPDETVVLTEVSPGESLKYYRDEEDVHYVPKRRLEDILL